MRLLYFPTDVIKLNVAWIQICRPTRNEDTIDVLGAAVAAVVADAADDVATADAQMNKK